MTNFIKTYSILKKYQLRLCFVFYALFELYGSYTMFIFTSIFAFKVNEYLKIINIHLYQNSILFQNIHEVINKNVNIKMYGHFKIRY